MTNSTGYPMDPGEARGVRIVVERAPGGGPILRRPVPSASYESEIPAKAEPENRAAPARTTPGGAGNAVHKYSVTIADHRTSISLEGAFWQGLREIADRRGISVNRLVSEIDERRRTNLSSAIRVHVLQFYRSQSGSMGPQAR